MAASKPIKSAGPILVVGLSCTYPGGGLQDLVDKHFSPVAQAVDDSTAPSIKGSNLFPQLIHLIESAVLDARLDQIPADTVVIATVSNPPHGYVDTSSYLKTSFSASAENEGPEFRSAGSATEAIEQALACLDSGKFSFAMVAACEPHETHLHGASVLLGTGAAIERTGIQPYSCLELGDPAGNRKAAALIEICNKDWLKSTGSLLNLQKQIFQLSSPVPESARAYDSPGPSTDEPTWTKNDPFSYISTLALELAGGSEDLSAVFALLTAALALDLRVIPSCSEKFPLRISGSSMAQCKAARPWIHPASQVEPDHPRRCLIQTGGTGLLLFEHGDDINTISLRKLQRQSSELFIFSGKSKAELHDNLANQAGGLLQMSQRPLWELAYRQNCLNGQAGEYRLAIVAGSIHEFQKLAREAIAHLELTPERALTQIGIRCDEPSNHTQSPVPATSAPSSVNLLTSLKRQIVSPATGIYYSALPASKPGKMVFVYPGLGAAYPQMLADLCFFFPEVRQVFDYVERLALKAADQVIPSRVIFPVAPGPDSSNQARLATMDSSVVTLLLAEWAMHALLKSAGVQADILLGCSTGEFAALTISEAANILESAETFYALSTHVSRSISPEQLSDLRSIRVAAPFQTIKAILPPPPQTVYLSADLSDTCVLLSGQRSAIEELCRRLRERDIDYLPLPVAVPYHTPLVAGKISEDDTADLKMGLPCMETWSCSLEDRYPDDASKLRRLSTELFETPILLRTTVEKLYGSGARIFVEIGPKGGLAPYISEVLAGREHLSIAANLAGKSGIDQFNALLGVLSCHGLQMNLKTLYQRRVDPERRIGTEARIDTEPNVDTSWRSDREYASSSGFPSGALPDEDIDNQVMLSYLSTMKRFHESLMSTHERVLTTYLLGAPDEEPAIAEAEPLLTNLAFLQGATIQTSNDVHSIQLSLNTDRHRFLLDHAIGGEVESRSEAGRVCLVPLMVTLEIMAEGASLLLPHLQISRLTDIRAYKRIRTGNYELGLLLQLQVANETTVRASIFLGNGEKDDANKLASCIVEFSPDLPSAAAPLSWARQDPRTSRLSPNKLYGPGSMFHGPAMQSVTNIDSVSRRVIEGRINCRKEGNWFTYPVPDLLLDPLLLDNSSQFVLYQMYEHDMPVTALLPFHIGSIELFQGYKLLRGATVYAQALLNSMTLRGTEAQIQLADAGGKIVARVNDISSRAIVLGSKARDFVMDPSGSLAGSIKMEGTGLSVIKAVFRADLPEDETALDWLTDYLLTECEQNEWRNTVRTEKRRLDRLMGRIAAKDAVRALMQEQCGIALKAADIEIRNTEQGDALVFLDNARVPWIPQISISHCSRVAVAVAEPPRKDRLAGIDLEEITERDAGFEELAFSPSERSWLAERPKSERSLHIARLWTAKEAAAKACGQGLSDALRSFELVADAASHNSLKISGKGICSGRGGTCNCLVNTQVLEGISLAIVTDTPEPFQ